MVVSLKDPSRAQPSTPPPYFEINWKQEEGIFKVIIGYFVSGTGCIVSARPAGLRTLEGVGHRASGIYFRIKGVFSARKEPYKLFFPRCFMQHAYLHSFPLLAYLTNLNRLVTLYGTIYGNNWTPARANLM